MCTYASRCEAVYTTPNVLLVWPCVGACVHWLSTHGGSNDGHGLLCRCGRVSNHSLYTCGVNCDACIAVDLFAGQAVRACLLIWSTAGRLGHMHRHSKCSRCSGTSVWECGSCKGGAPAHAAFPTRVIQKTEAYSDTCSAKGQALPPCGA